MKFGAANCCRCHMLQSLHVQGYHSFLEIIFKDISRTFVRFFQDVFNPPPLDTRTLCTPFLQLDHTFCTIIHTAMFIKCAVYGCYYTSNVLHSKKVWQIYSRIAQSHQQLPVKHKQLKLQSWFGQFSPQLFIFSSFLSCTISTGYFYFQ